MLVILAGLGRDRVGGRGATDSPQQVHNLLQPEYQGQSGFQTISIKMFGTPLTDPISHDFYWPVAVSFYICYVLHSCCMVFI